MIGLYPTECTTRDRPFKTVDQVELATLCGSTGTAPDASTQHPPSAPIEDENAYYDHHQPPTTPGRFRYPPKPSPTSTNTSSNPKISHK